MVAMNGTLVLVAGSCRDYAAYPVVYNPVYITQPYLHYFVNSNPDLVATREYQDQPDPSIFSTF